MDNVFPQLDLSPTASKKNHSPPTSPNHSTKKSKSPFQVRLNPSQTSKSSSTLDKFNLEHYKTIVEKYGDENKSSKEFKLFQKSCIKIQMSNSLEDIHLFGLISKVKNIFMTKCLSLYEEAVNVFDLPFQKTIGPYAIKFFKQDMNEALEDYSNPHLLHQVANVYDVIEKDARQVRVFFSEIKEHLQIIPIEKIQLIFECAYNRRFDTFEPSKMSLEEMGRQTNQFFTSIISNTPEMFKTSSIFRKFFISNELYYFFDFESKYLGEVSENQDDDSDTISSAKTFTKLLSQNWDLHQYKETSYNEGANKFIFLVEHFKSLCPQDQKKDWDLSLQTILKTYSSTFLQNPNDQVIINLFYGIICKHLQSLHSPQWLIEKEKSQKNVVPFYPTLDQRDIPFFCETITWQMKGVDLISSMQEKEEIIKNRMISSAIVFNIYSEVIDFLASYSSENLFFLHEYLLIMKNIKNELTVDSQPAELIKKIPEWIKETSDQSFYTLNPVKASHLPGISQGVEGTLEPIKENEILNLLSPKIQNKKTFLDITRKEELTGLTTERGTCANHTWGAATAQGKRPYQEDDYIQGVISCLGGKKFPFFALMDGHGSRTSVDFVKKNLGSTLTFWLNMAFAEIKKTEDCSEAAKLIIIHNALKIASVDLDQWLLKLSNNYVYVGGTTLVVSIIDGENAWQVNVGDSIAYCYAKKKLCPITDEAELHKPFYIKRVNERGGNIFGGRINSILNMANAIGDHKITGRSAEGIITYYRLPKHKRLIFLSDGISDYLPLKLIQEILINNKDPEKAAKKLVHYAWKKGSEDNMTAVVVKIITKSHK